LARVLKIGGQAKVQKEATRRWFSNALRQGKVINASCHGSFDSHNFLQSALHLAGGYDLPLGALLSHEIDLQGLRLIILSACQTAIVDLSGAREEVHSLAAGMLQAGARGVLAALWSVDDRATYLLMVRFAQEWFPKMHNESPAAALARAQHWLRTVTNRELLEWEATQIPATSIEEKQEAGVENTSGSAKQGGSLALINEKRLAVIRGRGNRYMIDEAVDEVHRGARQRIDLDICPYADPIYWAAFQITGW
jgi:CHAT domain-containing protein